MLEQAFEALKTYKWGIDPKGIKPIQDAVVATHGNAAARKELESKLAAALDTDIPRAAKDSVCRFLKTIGTSHSVPALAKLLHDAELSHMARHALQTIDAKEAASALVNAIDKAPKKIKIGIISTPPSTIKSKKLMLSGSIMLVNESTIALSCIWKARVLVDKFANRVIGNAIRFW